MMNEHCGLYFPVDLTSDSILKIVADLKDLISQGSKTNNPKIFIKLTSNNTYTERNYDLDQFKTMLKNGGIQNIKEVKISLMLYANRATYRHVAINIESTSSNFLYVSCAYSSEDTVWLAQAFTEMKEIVKAHKSKSWFSKKAIADSTFGFGLVSTVMAVSVGLLVFQSIPSLLIGLAIGGGSLLTSKFSSDSSVSKTGYSLLPPPVITPDVELNKVY
jgi:hypothetical protein